VTAEVSASARRESTGDAESPGRCGSTTAPRYDNPGARLEKRNRFVEAARRCVDCTVTQPLCGRVAITRARTGHVRKIRNVVEVSTATAQLGSRRPSRATSVLLQHLSAIFVNDLSDAVLLSLFRHLSLCLCLARLRRGLWTNTPQPSTSNAVPAAQLGHDAAAPAYGAHSPRRGC